MFIFCVHYLCLIGRVYMFYVGHVNKSSLYEILSHCNTLSKHHHHHHNYGNSISSAIVSYICVFMFLAKYMYASSLIQDYD
jgi:hypothetical protein